SGCLLYIISQFFMQPYFINNALENAKASGIIDEASLAIVTAEAYPHFLDIMAILFLLNVGIMLLIGKLKPRKEAYIQEYTEQVDITPWKYVKQTGIAICIIVIGVYIYFA
ncbi:MAG: SSS family solute:Na+ symporter, partial [Flavobacteriaceae bacterium]